MILSVLNGRGKATRRTKNAVLLILGLTGLLSCFEDLPTTPRHFQIPVSKLNPDMRALPAVITTISWTPASSIFLANYPYPEKVLAALRIDGTINMTSHPNAWYAKYNGPLDARGIYVGGVYHDCFMQVKIGGFGPACLSNDDIGSQPSWVDTLLVTGNVYATRGNAVPWLNPSCSATGDPCHTYSGLQAITLIPLPADFKTVITGGEFGAFPRSVYWSSTVTPNIVHGIAMPRRMVSRVWVKADPADSTGAAASPACSLNEFACGAWVMQSGMWIETARANGLERVDSAAVYCSDSVSDIITAKVRKGLRTALDSSGYPNVNPQFRNERVFFILQDTVTPGAKPYVKLMPPQNPVTPCFSWNPPDFNQRDPNTKLLGWGHTHPSELSTVICTDSLGNPETNYMGDPIARDLAVGTSVGDYNKAVERSSPTYPYYVGPVNMYVVTPSMFYVVKPTQLPESPMKIPSNNQVLRFGKCAWASFS